VAPKISNAEDVTKLNSAHLEAVREQFSARMTLGPHRIPSLSSLDVFRSRGGIGGGLTQRVACRSESFALG
jgi:hypothetical protein